MEYGLIGAKLGHSYSAPIHAQLGDYDYRLYERTEEEFVDLLRRRDFKGLNVTIPYKQLALRLCDELSETARSVGSVNTLIVRSDGTLYGHNTDIGGFIAMTRHAGIEISGRKAIVLGSGGTSLTAQAACRQLGAREIIVVSRKGPVDYETLYRDHADGEIIINTTPVGMYPNNGATVVDLRRFEHLAGVLDVIYNPDRTALIMEAQSRGIPCAGGLYMLVDQAREAAELFTGHAIDARETDRIYAMLRSDMLNLVLIGMPGCGKTTLGRTLAERMGRTFVDCDAEIERRAQKRIPDIFSQDGEPAFRELEAQVIADVCRERRCVIATGGGAVLRPENIRAMRQNGKVAFIERALDALAQEGRPLSRSREALQDMWKCRAPLYRAGQDFIIDNNSDLERSLAQAEEGFYEAAHH